MRLLRNIRVAQVFSQAMSSLAFLEAVALTSAALYAGATSYVALVEQPSRLDSGSVDLAQWGRSNDRAPRYAASALVGAAAAFVLTAMSTPGWPWVGGLGLFLVGALG